MLIIAVGFFLGSVFIYYSKLGIYYLPPHDKTGPGPEQKKGAGSKI